MSQDLAPPPSLPSALSGLKVALVHDWLVSTRGGESVLASLVRLFPGAPVHTLFYQPDSMTGAVGAAIRSAAVVPSALQRIPAASRVHRALLPLFPYAVEAFDLRAFDLVISSSHCVAKGVLCRPDAVHVSYIHTPMRYAYEQLPEYFGPGRLPLPLRGAARLAMHHLRLWDEVTASRVDHYVANSHHVATRVKTRYRRDAHVVHPPVDLGRFRVGSAQEKRNGPFLMVGAFAPYKRVDMAVQAFNRLGLPLHIIGGGQDERRIRAMAGPTVELLGRVDDAGVAEAYAGARAFVFPGEEDFGITPLEAMAAGTPVIALGRGGATETVLDVDDPQVATGVLFADQTVDGLCAAVERFVAAQDRFDGQAARARAAQFDRAGFERRMLDRVVAAVAAGKDPLALPLVRSAHPAPAPVTG